MTRDLLPSPQRHHVDENNNITFEKDVWLLTLNLSKVKEIVFGSEKNYIS